MKSVSLAALAMALAVSSSAAAKTSRHESDMVRIDKASPPAMTYALFRNSGTHGSAINVYLNRHGATIMGGWENSARLTSGLVARRGLRGTRIPRFRGTRYSWRAIVRCVKKRYSEFNVDIHTKRPSGRYIMALVGGNSYALGYNGRIGGVAPYNGRIIDNAIVFVFDRNWRRTASICNTIVHEIGHTLGLEHQYLCKDPMSYLRGCGTKTFQDVDAWCGEYRRRRCRTGRTQNTYRRLARTVGLHNSQPDPDTDTDTDTDTGVDPDIGTRPQPPIVRRRRPRRDRTGPSVSIVAPRGSRSTSLDGDSTIRIVVRARDASGISSVQLGWGTPDQRFVFVCGKIPHNMPVTCSRRGSYYTFELRVGYGRRIYSVRVVDRAGNSTFTRPTVLSFGRLAQRVRPRWQQTQRPRYPQPDQDYNNAPGNTGDYDPQN